MPSQRGKTWQARVRVNGEVYTRDGFRTKKDALAHEAIMRREAKSRKKLTGSDLLSASVEYQKYVENNFVQKTITEKKSCLNRAIKRFGPDADILSIPREEWENHFKARRKEVSKNAANVDRKNIHAMYQYFIDNIDAQKRLGFFIEVNPISKLKRFDHEEEHHYTPTAEDMIKVMKTCNQEEWIFLNTYLQTGARKSEVLRLKWSDINFNTRKLRLTTKKTKGGFTKENYIDISDELSEALLWWKDNRPVKDGNYAEYVFVNTDERSKHYGKPYTARNRFMIGLCKRAGVKHFGFHGIRGYTASFLADSNVPVKIIQEILGHASLATTEKYLKRIKASNIESMNLLSTGISVKDFKNEP